MDEQKKKETTPKKVVNKASLKRQAHLKLIALLVILVMCSVVMLYLMADEPSQAELKVIAYAREKKISALQYPQEFIELLEEVPEAEEVVLNYPEWKDDDPEIDLSTYDLREGVPLLKQWDKRWGYMKYGDSYVAVSGSGPLCLAMAGYYVTGDAKFYPDRVVEFAQENGFCDENGGTEPNFIYVGGNGMDLKVTKLAVVEDKIANQLRAGHPVIAYMGPGDFTDTNHYVVLTEYSDGVFRLHDPYSMKNSGKTWTFDELEGQIRRAWLIEAGQQA